MIPVFLPNVYLIYCMQIKNSSYSRRSLFNMFPNKDEQLKNLRKCFSSIYLELSYMLSLLNIGMKLKTLIGTFMVPDCVDEL